MKHLHTAEASDQDIRKVEADEKKAYSWTISLTTGTLDFIFAAGPLRCGLYISLSDFNIFSSQSYV